MKIRQATNEDAFGIAQVHIASWKSTYKGLILDSILDNLMLEKRVELWIKNISDENKIVFVLENDNGIIGFMDGQRVEDALYENYDADLTSLYLYEEQKGNGYGRKMLEELFKQFKMQGMNSCIVKVLANNPSKYFYERLGAIKIDTFDASEYGEGVEIDVYAWNII